MTKRIPKDKPEQRSLLLRIEGAGQPEYWLDVEAESGATLAELDALLRRTWLECCGHMSAFHSSRRAFDDLRQGLTLEDALAGRRLIAYTYDFGSSTNLIITLKKRVDPAGVSAIRIVGRNEAPEAECGECGSKASALCTYCEAEEGGSFLCEKHIEEHECGDEGILPVVNSPRMGVCGYGG